MYSIREIWKIDVHNGANGGRERYLQAGQREVKQS